jgi:hypothetical protein
MLELTTGLHRLSANCARYAEVALEQRRYPSDAVEWTSAPSMTFVFPPRWTPPVASQRLRTPIESRQVALYHEEPSSAYLSLPRKGLLLRVNRPLYTQGCHCLGKHALMVPPMYRNMKTISALSLTLTLWRTVHVDFGKVIGVELIRGRCAS